MPRTIIHVVLGVFAFAVSLQAHHSVAATYDANRVVTFTGIITSVEWRNPHVILHLEVKNADGNLVDWRMEMLGPKGLSAMRECQRPGAQRYSKVCAGASAGLGI
jgi:hypothetical protein